MVTIWRFGRLIPIKRVFFDFATWSLFGPKGGEHMSGKKETQSKPNRKQRRRTGMCQEDRPILEENAAGIDVGAREMFVAVPPDRDQHPVRVFDTFTEDLQQLAEWLVECGIKTVAMDSTGVCGFRCTTFWKSMV
jgi:hypothetical protein